MDWRQQCSDWFLQWYGVLAFLGSAMGGFGLFWDIAWHTDLGRETVFIPPHLVTLSSIAAVLLLTAGVWYLLRRQDRLNPVLERCIAAVFVSGGLFYIGFGVDDLWHRVFGVDVSLWSPPHLSLLATAAAATLFTALLVQNLDKEYGSSAVRRFSVYLLLSGVLGALLAVVTEFEIAALPVWHPAYTRPGMFYPVIVTGVSMFVAGLTRYVTRWRYAFTGVAVLFAAMKTVFMYSVDLLMRSAPGLPPFVFAAAFAVDVLHREERGAWYPVLIFTAVFAVAEAARLYFSPLPHVYMGEVVAAAPLAFLAAWPLYVGGCRLSQVLCDVFTGRDD